MVGSPSMESMVLLCNRREVRMGKAMWAMPFSICTSDSHLPQQSLTQAEDLDSPLPQTFIISRLSSLFHLLCIACINLY